MGQKHFLPGEEGLGSARLFKVTWHPGIQGVGCFFVPMYFVFFAGTTVFSMIKSVSGLCSKNWSCGKIFSLNFLLAWLSVCCEKPWQDHRVWRSYIIILHQGGVANKKNQETMISLLSLCHLGMGAIWVEKHGLEKGTSGASTESLWQYRRNGMLSEIWEAHRSAFENSIIQSIRHQGTMWFFQTSLCLCISKMGETFWVRIFLTGWQKTIKSPWPRSGVVVNLYFFLYWLSHEGFILTAL